MPFEFNIEQLLNDPRMQSGLALLAASRQANPYQAALQNLLQMQQAQQQAETAALIQRQRQIALDEDARKRNFLQQQTAQIVQQGPPTAEQQQHIMRLRGMEAGLSPTELAAVEPDPYEARRKQIMLLGGGSYLDLTDNQRVGVSPEIAKQKIALEERKVAAQESRAKSYEKRVDQQLAKSSTTSATRIPMEVVRMNIGMENATKTLDKLEALLRGRNLDDPTKPSVDMPDGFDPRNLADQLNMTKRGYITSKAGELLLQGKEAGGLGALQKADVELMQKIFAFPTSPQGALLGREGILAQIKAARDSFADRRKTMQEQYPGLASTNGPTREAATQLIQSTKVSPQNVISNTLTPQEENWISDMITANPASTRDEIIAYGKQKGRIK